MDNVMHTSFSSWIWHSYVAAKLKYLVLIFMTIIAVTGCDSVEDGESGRNEALIGTWRLVTVNGQPIAGGVVLIYTFTAETLTITSDLDCVEVIDYTWASDGSLTGRSISMSGSQCSDEEDQATFNASVEGDTLTLVVNDPEFGTAIFVFTRIS